MHKNFFMRAMGEIKKQKDKDLNRLKGENAAKNIVEQS